MTTPNVAGQLTDFKNRETWLANRTSGIGASEVAILFGLAPSSWGSTFELWAKKTKRLPTPDLEGEWLEWGNILEPVIADRYATKTGNKIWSGGGQFCVAQHPRIPFFRCTPDRWVVEADGRETPGLLQIKNAGQYMAHDWETGVPDHVQIQEQAEMAVTGAAWADVAVLIGGNRFAHFTVQRDDAFIDEMERQVSWFWDLVERNEPPPVDGSEATARALKALHPMDDGSEVELPPDAIDWAEQLEDAKAKIKSAKKFEDEAKNKLIAAIGDSTFGVLPDGRRFTFKHQDRGGYVVEPTTFRVLRLEAAKRAKK